MGRMLAVLCVLFAVEGVLGKQHDSNELPRASGISVDWQQLAESSPKLKHPDPAVVAASDSGDGGVESYHPRRISRRSAGLDWNVIVDNLLVEARQFITAEGHDEVPIPDINEGFEKRFGFIKAHGRFEAWEGRVNSISSIRRTGEVSFTSVPNSSVTLTTHLGFGTLRVRYNGYKAEIWNFGPRGHIEASVGENSVRLKLRMDVEGETSCKLVLEEAAVEKLEGMSVHVSGLGPLDWLTSRIVTWVARERRGHIIESIERALRRGLTRSLEKVPCDLAYMNM